MEFGKHVAGAHQFDPNQNIFCPICKLIGEVYIHAQMDLEIALNISQDEPYGVHNLHLWKHLNSIHVDIMSEYITSPPPAQHKPVNHHTRNFQPHTAIPANNPPNTFSAFTPTNPPTFLSTAPPSPNPITSANNIPAAENIKNLGQLINDLYGFTSNNFTSANTVNITPNNNNSNATSSNNNSTVPSNTTARTNTPPHSFFNTLQQYPTQNPSIPSAFPFAVLQPVPLPPPPPPPPIPARHMNPTPSHLPSQKPHRHHYSFHRRHHRHDEEEDEDEEINELEDDDDDDDKQVLPQKLYLC